ncbi:MAG: DUF1294 domain-containing protein [Clostridia bacterium]|nr:DUF1294 domain-containing protein [Clostridia bacterium]
MTLINEIGITKILIYLLIVNLIAFIAMWLDKWKAKNDAWRIPESTLMALALIGGSIGGITGMYTFRHKTKKPKFFIGIPVILALQIIVVIYILTRK